MTEIFNPHSSGNRLRVSEHYVPVKDEYANEKFDDVNAEVDRLARIGTAYYAQMEQDISRKRLSSIDLIDNPATRELTELLPSVGAWLRTIPTAAALHPLYEPDSKELPNGTLLDADIPDWFKNIADARGIRSRAVVMKDILYKEAVDGEDMQWLSLASGAAQPVFEIINELRDEGVALPQVTLADRDKNALSLANSYAAQHGLEQVIQTQNLNILKRNGLSFEPGSGIAGLAASAIAKRMGKFEKGSFDAVDAVGIFEYLKRPDWKYTYDGVISTSKQLAGAETFLKNAFELVKPGGILVIGNMLDTHPQIEFTLNVIQWPHIQPRSVTEMIEIMKTVGIEGDVDIYRPDDGVYAIYGIRKPL